jgi:serine/threonine-protein kinase
MSDVFVSYKAEDRRRVKPLVEALQADGYSIWWDEQIGGGAAWRHTIEAELNAAKSVIVIWSSRSVGREGEFVQDEAARAKERQVYIPVTIEKVHLPLGFGETQALPLTGWHGSRSDARYQAVLNAVRRLAGEATGATVGGTPPGSISRRAVLAAGAAAAAAGAGVGAWALLKPGAAEASSIAVLPFANLSGDPAQAYFSDGIAEEIRSALARLGGLTVIGRTSSEAVRNEDAPTAAKKLRVRNILTGSVRQSPSTIRITAELVDGKTGADRWSQDYDRSPGDAIKIQTDIAENVASALSAALGGAAREAITVGETANAQAQKLFWKANEASNGTRDGYERALQLLDEALQLDPNYASAYALKSIVIRANVDAFGSSPEELVRGRAQAFSLAQKALRIAPNLAIVHGAIAELHRSQLDFQAALREYRRMNQLAGSNPDAMHSYASFIVLLGHFSEGLRLADRIISLDRLNPYSYRFRAGVLFEMRHYGEAVSYLEKLKRDSPDLFNSPIGLGDNLQMIGRYDDARKSYAEAPDNDIPRIVGEAVLAARSGNRTAALKSTARLQQLYQDNASYQYAEIYAQLGDRNRAFQALERAWEIRDPGLIATKVDPWLDPIRHDRRYDALIRKLQFPA